MNERIKELAKQSLPASYLTNCPSALDKFARLIIQDCVATMYKHGEAYAHPSAGFYQAKTFSEAIMEHFGVKE